jgi:hypothetical protein
MNDFIPVNDLDNAIMAMQRSKAAMPELFRRLRQGSLYLVLPFHPEVANQTMELKNGMPMPFVRFTTERGVVVPAYSSEARFYEGLEKIKLAARNFMAAEMPAVQALEIVGKMKLRLAINHGCATGSITLPPKTLCDVADATALQPLGMSSGRTEHLVLNKIDPADYPTDLLQAVFELFRKYRNFRAAWIFTRTVAGQPTPKFVPYYLLVLMAPRDEAIFHDFNLVAQAARGQHELNLSHADEHDTAYLATLFQQATPFYQAADYQPPGPAGLPAA